MTANTTLTSSSDNSPDGLTGDAADQLQRLRWAVRASLALGVVASVAANVLHARPNPISQIIAAWPPPALLLTVELISRAPHHRRLLRAIRLAATAVIAAIATWVSYWHLVGVAARYGETEHGAAYLLPISVDGLVIVASVSLVEITARIHAATLGTAQVTSPTAPPLAKTYQPQPSSPRPALGRSETAGTTTRPKTSRRHDRPRPRSYDRRTATARAGRNCRTRRRTQTQTTCRPTPPQRSPTGGDVTPRCTRQKSPPESADPNAPSAATGHHRQVTVPAHVNGHLSDICPRTAHRIIRPEPNAQSLPPPTAVSGGMYRAKPSAVFKAP